MKKLHFEENFTNLLISFSVWTIYWKEAVFVLWVIPFAGGRAGATTGALCFGTISEIVTDQWESNAAWSRFVALRSQSNASHLLNMDYNAFCNFASCFFQQWNSSDVLRFCCVPSYSFPNFSTILPQIRLRRFFFVLKTRWFAQLLGSNFCRFKFYWKFLKAMLFKIVRLNQMGLEILQEVLMSSSVLSSIIAVFGQCSLKHIF